MDLLFPSTCYHWCGRNETNSIILCMMNLFITMKDFMKIVSLKFWKFPFIGIRKKFANLKVSCSKKTNLRSLWILTEFRNRKLLKNVNDLLH